MKELTFFWDRLENGDLRITDNSGGVRMANHHECQLILHIETVESKLASALEERDVLDGVNRRGDEVIVDLTLKLDRLVEVLKVTAGNIRSLGPAGQLPEPYRPWLQAVESAIEGAK